jgi:hypothetical protein
MHVSFSLGRRALPRSKSRIPAPYRPGCRCLHVSALADVVAWLLATIKTSLRHLAGDKLHDTQLAIYGCRKVDGEWRFVSHLSVEVTQ